MKELASLQRQDPNSVADVAEVVNGVLELESALDLGRACSFEVGYLQPGLVASVHPSALRQTLIATVGRLARQVTAGPIRLYARLRNANVRITITGDIGVGRALIARDFTDNVLVPGGGSVEASFKGSHVFLWVTVPALGEVNVLAIDDNPDMVRFYRRCTTGTRFRITHAATGRRALEMIEAGPPDVVVLDVMLPDVDGWKLLMQLHQGPLTRRLPVIVCSVVAERDLALALGAARYLPKPVEPRRFVEALDSIALQVTEGSPTAPMHSSSRC